MKRQRLLGLSAILLSQLAVAAEPSLSAPALGTLEATFNFCAQVDPNAATQYQAQVKLLAQGVSEETLAAVRKTDAYHQAYDSVSQSMSKASRRDALKACADSITVNK